MRRCAFAISLTIVALVAGWVGWSVFFPGPERVIRRSLEEIQILATFSASEAPLAKLANSRKLAAYFAPEVQIAVDVPGRPGQVIQGAEDLLQALMAARAQILSLKVRFLDINISVADGRQAAVANLTVRGSIAGEADELVQELNFWFQKSGRDWLIRRVETVKTLR